MKKLILILVYILHCSVYAKNYKTDQEQTVNSKNSNSAKKSLALMSEDRIEVAVIGDSSGTGAIADPRVGLHNMFPNLKDLSFYSNLPYSPLKKGAEYITEFPPDIEHYSNPTDFNIKSPIESPLILSDHTGKKMLKPEKPRKLPPNMAYKLLLLRFQKPEYSWGYLVGKKLGYAGKNIALAAHDGKRVDNAYKQVDSLLAQMKKTGQKYLPRYIFIMFVANDICNKSRLDDLAITAEQERKNLPYNEKVNNRKTTYYNKLKKALNLLNQYKPHPEGTEVVVLASLDPISVIQNKSILRKEVPFQQNRDYTSKISCLELRAKEVPKRYNTSMLRFKHGLVKGMCDSILKTNLTGLDYAELPEESKARIERLDYLHRLHIEAQRDAIFDMQQTAQYNMRFSFYEDTYNMQLSASDVGNDCFHPSLKLHERIAEKLFHFIGNPSTNQNTYESNNGLQ